MRAPRVGTTWSAVVILGLSAVLVVYGLGGWAGDPLAPGLIGLAIGVAALADG